MKSFTSYLGFILVLLGSIFYACTSQKPTESVQKTLPDSLGSKSYEKHWDKIATYQEESKPRSIIKTGEKIYRKASRRNNPVQQLKSLITIQKARHTFQEKPRLKNIKETKQKINADAYFPLKPILHSLLAQQYFQYYRTNQYSINDRSSTGESNSDPSTWGKATFYDTISHHYLKSLEPANKLHQFHIAAFTELLKGSSNTRALRPSLLDLLSHRALDFFEQDVPFKTLPVNDFLIDKPAFFAPFQKFAQKNFQTPDSSSPMFLATRIYQNLIHHQIRDSLNKALVHSSLERLKSMHKKAALPEKDSFYYNALANLIESHPKNPVTAEALYQQAKLVHEGYHPPDFSNNRPVKEIALAICENTIESHPNTHGSRQCKVLKAQIEKPQLQIQTEESYIPREPSKFLLQYKEIDSLYYTIIPISRKKSLKISTLQEEAMLNELKSRKPLYKLKKELPLPLDYNNHRIEIGLPGLDKGTYALLVSSGNQYQPDKNLLEANIFQVTNLGLVQMKEGKKARQNFYVLNSKTGEPVKKARIEVLKRQYDQQKKGYNYNTTKEITPDDHGTFAIDQMDERAYLKIYKGTDTFYPEDPIFHNRYYDRNQPEKRAHTFTDRSIYRPGQAIHFKTVMVQSTENETDKKPISGEKVSVKLMDVNNQEIAVDTFQSNKYGAFAGEFKIPEGTLTGNYRIQTPYGNQVVSVEAYKRPQFEVNLDNPSDAYKLGEKVEISGNATTYSGVPLDNGRIRYKVKRKARFPYWYWRRPIPSTSSKIIKTGQTNTNNAGDFSLKFTAEPDPTIAKSKQPIFRYEVKVTVTDETGETQTKQKSIKAGYAAYYPALHLEEWQEAGNPLTIKPIIENAGGKPVNQSGLLTIEKLKQPNRLLRKQYWSTPDQYLENKKSYMAKYPHDPYKEEAQPENWKVQDTLLATSLKGNQDTTLDFDGKNALQTGYYQASLMVANDSENATKTRQFFKVFRENEESLAIKEFSYLIPLKTTVEPGQKSRFIWGSADDQAIAMVNVEHQGTIIHQEKIKASNSQKIIEFPIEEKHRGNIHIHLFSVNENRINHYHKTVKVPWSNKKLDIKLETFRSTLEPGTSENWSLTIKDHNKNPANAALLANMYDASLDAIKDHQWRFDIFPSFSSKLHFKPYNSFSLSRRSYLNSLTPHRYKTNVAPPRRTFEDFDIQNFRQNRIFYSMADKQRGEAAQEERAVKTKNTDQSPKDEEENDEKTDALRKKLQETAFFKPQLKTNSQGEVQFSFEAPEALSRWKVMFLAHDQDMANTYLEKEVLTQKQLMVEPYVPRFLRSGDQMKLTTKVSNLTDSVLTGPLRLKLLNPKTGNRLGEAFNLQKGQKAFTLEPQSSKTFQWAVRIPDTVEAVTYRITADAGKHKDGQEDLLPILPQKEFVTESQPLWLTGSGKQTFNFDRIAKSQSSQSLRNHRITLEMASNPAWYGVQALPSIMKPNFDNAVQIFNAYYANSLAHHIISTRPEIQKVFKEWEASGALKSQLAKNQQLKDVALDETPWLKEASNETEMQQQLAKMFQKEKVETRLNQYLNKLKNLQLNNGAWPWFEGMKAGRSITYYILGNLGRLESLNAKMEANRSLQNIKQKALSYADESMQTAWQKIMERDTTKGKQYIYHDMVRYLYARSFFTNKEIGPTQAFRFWLKQAKDHWKKESLIHQAMIALAMNRYGENKTAGKIMASLEEKALHDEEMGMYWAANQPGYQWHQAPIETQALLIEAFKTIKDDQAAVEAMKAWLLKQKQVQSWKTSKATADACYALLMEGSDWLSENQPVQIKLNGEVFKQDENLDKEAGTGYFKKTWQRGNIKPEQFKEIQLQKSSKGLAWGAVHWQYFEKPNKITRHETPLSVEKQLYVQENTDKGKKLKAINSNTTLNKGDLVKVRLKLESDRSMDFVHLKDHRASALEPVEQLSGYRYQGDLGYYRNIKDASANFFFQYLPKGTHVFEYNLRVSHDGEFQNGTARVQSMYAPEFNSHSEGRMIRVKQME